jgi:hypothetical protein
MFVTTEKQHFEAEKQHIYHMLQSVGLPSGKVNISLRLDKWEIFLKKLPFIQKNDHLDPNTLTQEKFFQFYLRLVSKEDIEKIFSE